MKGVLTWSWLPAESTLILLPASRIAAWIWPGGVILYSSMGGRGQVRIHKLHCWFLFFPLQNTLPQVQIDYTVWGTVIYCLHTERELPYEYSSTFS